MHMLVSYKKTYLPAVTAINKNTSMLVAVINIGNDSALITVGRTQSIKEVNKNNSHTGAYFSMHDDTDNSKYYSWEFKENNKWI